MTSGMLNNAEVPDGIPQGLSVGQAGRVLNLPAERIKGAVKSGDLPSYQIKEGYGWRWVKPEDLAAFALARGLSLDWGAVV